MPKSRRATGVASRARRFESPATADRAFNARRRCGVPRRGGGAFNARTCDGLTVAGLRRWSRGRVVLAGDAAHSPLPHQGQGAGQAIESAYTLAPCWPKPGRTPSSARSRFTSGCAENAPGRVAVSAISTKPFPGDGYGGCVAEPVSPSA
ncbi:FAD-dependent monooxygenase [Kibdelosporangium aridum]|uniref:FAD-dependent monooxygenase n=1 Tax=Kibdelosporangium aridum TaxID=2030 RepID=UPI0035ED14DC